MNAHLWGVSVIRHTASLSRPLGANDSWKSGQPDRMQMDCTLKYTLQLHSSVVSLMLWQVWFAWLMDCAIFESGLMTVVIVDRDQSLTEFEPYYSPRSSQLTLSRSLQPGPPPPPPPPLFLSITVSLARKRNVRELNTLISQGMVEAKLSDLY